MGQDGEPFVALNEAWVVFAEFFGSKRRFGQNAHRVGGAWASK